MVTIGSRFADLLDASGTFGAAGGSVGDTLAGLDAGLVSLRQRWVGAASDGFDSTYAGWLAAADGMRATIDELGGLLATVHGNYREADRAGRAIWGGRPDAFTGPEPGGGFRLTLDDLRVTATTFAGLQRRLVAAIERAGEVLAGTAGMAGQDRVLATWRCRYDPMAWALARSVRAVSVVLAVVAQKLVETANAYVDAENAATPGSPTLERLPAPDVRFDDNGLVPPLSEGPNPEFVPGDLAEYWPNADTARLRLAGDAWLALHHELAEVNNAATAAFTALFDASDGATFSLMRGYWEMLCTTEPPVPCTPDPGAGLKPFNLVSYLTAMVAGSCGDLAALVDNTRRNMALAAQEAADDEIMEIFAWIAEVLDAWRTAGASTTVVDIGKAVLLGGYLDAERDTYLIHLRWLADKLLDVDRQRLDVFSDTHDTTQEVAPSFTEAADVITGDLRGKWHELPDTQPHPTPDQIHITPDRRTHILDGDATGGGHRAGSPNNKSHFPPNWVDDKIIQEVVSIARDPDRIERNQTGRWKAFGVRDGVLIEVIVNADGTIRSAWPVSGPGVRPRQ